MSFESDAHDMADLDKRFITQQEALNTTLTGIIEWCDDQLESEHSRGNETLYLAKRRLSDVSTRLLEVMCDYVDFRGPLLGYIAGVRRREARRD